MRARVLVLTVVLTAGLTTGTESAIAAADCTSVERLASMAPDSQLSFAAECLKPDETVVVAGLPVAVPPPEEGTGLYQSLEESDVSVTGVDVENHDSQISVSTFSAGHVFTPSSPSACSDGARAWSGRRNNGYEYYISSVGIPSTISYNTFYNEISFADITVDTGRNDCGFATGGLGINITRKGSTTLRAMRADGTCFGDGYDVIDFGGLPSGVVGRTCARWNVVPFADDRIFEADVRLRSATKWYRTIPAGCSNAYEMAGVLTHEFGHVFGMNHVSEADHAFLTMSTNATSCSYADNTWGRGDYDNLQVHY